MEQKYKKLLADIFIFAIGNIGSKLILFFLVPLYTNVLTKDEFGVAELVFTASQLLIPFVSLVIFDAVTRFGLSKAEKPENVLCTGFVVLGVGSIVTVLATPLFELYPSLAPWRWYLCIYVIVSMVGSVEMNYLKVLDKNKLYAGISIAQTAVLAICNILFLVVKAWGVKGYLLATILASSTSMVLAFGAGRLDRVLKKGVFDSKLAKRMLLYSVPLILNNVSWWVIQSSNKIMVEVMISTAALGLYTVATKIPSLINVLISIFSQAWGISAVKELETENDTQFYADVAAILGVIAFGAAITLTTIIKPFMYVYVGADYFDAWRYVPLLLASASFSAIASYYGSLYGALKLSVRNMMSTLFSALINICVNLICIMHWGIWGAIIGTTAAYLFLAYFRMIDVLRFVHFNPGWKAFVGNTILVLAHAVLVSFDFHIVFVSGIAILMFVAINHATLINMFKKIVRIK